ncbi:glutamate receptor ionotropic, delta-1-like [Argiope bruennichi]|uniref:glutamate receptor ionotropic, delta-1-like n=1 Tax=Argiope bruennichi TaxID=94029 RepID=UPI002495437B|nr:glutamate receptor ionotropic, delta-1-like [Argiope bruennichi]
MKFPSEVLIAVLPSKHMFEINKENNDIKVSGVEGKLLDILSSALKFNYQLFSPRVRDWGRLQNGNWTGLVGMVHRKEVDLALSTLTISEDRMEAIDFTSPYTIQDVTFIVSKPGVLDNVNDIFQPFDLYTWICTFLSVIIYSGLFYFLLSAKYPYSRLLLELFGSTIRLPTFINLNSQLVRILFSLWLIFTVVISFGYSSTLLSFMTLPLHQQPIRTFRELSEAVRSGSYKCMAEIGSTIPKSLSLDPMDHFVYLGNAVETNKWFFNISDLAKGKVKLRNTAILNVRFKLEMINGLVASYNPMEISNDVFASWKLAIGVRKGFCCTRKLNKVISRIWNSGLFEKLKSDEWFYMSSLVSKHTVETKENEQLTISDIYSSLVILCFGYSVSCCVCVGEIGYFYLKLSFLTRNQGSESKRKCY